MIPFFGAGIAILALAILGVARLFGAPATEEMPTPTPYSMGEMEMPPQTAVASEVPVTGNSAPVGVLRFQDGTAPADQITLTTSGMPLPATGNQYQAWLIGDDGEQRVPLGVITFDADGRGSLSFVDPQGRNLLGMYHGLEITVEPDPDGNPIPSNTIAYKVALPTNGFMHVRHVLYEFGDTPNQVGLIRGLRADTHLVNTHAQEMLVAYQSGDEARVRLQAETMLNIISGSKSENHKDWDGDGNVNDPGDGFGLLLNGDNEGYIQGTSSHADFAAASSDATENMRIHGEHVKIAATNIGNWTTTLRDQLILILGSPLNAEMEGMIRNAVALANQVENGFDVNGNENIEPIPGEGGAKTAYDHAYYMADMVISAASSPEQ